MRKRFGRQKENRFFLATEKAFRFQLVDRAIETCSAEMKLLCKKGIRIDPANSVAVCALRQMPCKLSLCAFCGKGSDLSVQKADAVGEKRDQIFSNDPILPQSFCLRFADPKHDSRAFRANTGFCSGTAEQSGNTEYASRLQPIQGSSLFSCGVYRKSALQQNSETLCSVRLGMKLISLEENLLSCLAFLQSKRDLFSI